MNPVTGHSSILKVENVTKRFGNLTAVDRLTLDVPAGMTFGLLGPNGAGKTTLLRMATGLIQPTEGKLTLFDGLEPTDIRSRSLIGYMPQNLAVYPGLTVKENIGFFGRLYGLRGDELEHRIEEMLRLTDLEEKRNVPVVNLSGGMARRVLLATALVHTPELLILDEPTAGVDPLLRIKIWELLRRLNREGTSILITTHHISEAEECGEVIFLRDGRLLDRGTPKNIMSKYSTENLESAFVKATKTVNSGREI
jgi:ABC-2 type transport system ATP-binding protein